MKTMDKTKNKKISPKEMYQPGNVIKKHSGYVLVVRNYDNSHYKLINLTNSQYPLNSFFSIDALVTACYSDADELVNAELVIK